MMAMRHFVLAFVLLASPFWRSQSTSGSDDCRALMVMEKLAQIAGWSHREVVTAQGQIVCTQNRVERSRDWPSPIGGTMKTPDGAWYYPNNGGRAIDERDGLYYPAPPGGVARLQGTWRYPQGILAKPPAPDSDPDPQWYPPNGAAMTQSKLIEWACQRLGVDRCRAPLREIQSARGDGKTLAVIELAWAAQNAGAKK
jgi:hypothetical protein